MRSQRLQVWLLAILFVALMVWVTTLAGSRLAENLEPGFLPGTGLRWAVYTGLMLVLTGGVVAVALGRAGWSGMSWQRRVVVARRWVIYALTLLLLVWLAMTVDWSRMQETFFDTQVAKDQFPEVVTQAARNTLTITALGFTGGFLFGLLLALMRLSPIRLYRWFATVYIEIFRGVPALLTIYIIGFGVPIALGDPIPGTYGPQTVALTVVAAAYIAETIRAGIQAVPKGQMEAARSVGMSYGRAMVSVILPQAFRVIIPPMTNELVLLLKDTALLSALGVTPATRELTRFARDNATEEFNSTPHIVAALMYLALTIPLTRVTAWLERRGMQAR